MKRSRTNDSIKSSDDDLNKEVTQRKLIKISDVNNNETGAGPSRQLNSNDNSSHTMYNFQNFTILKGKLIEKISSYSNKII